MVVIAILVTGGAGYIGSVTVALLQEQGHDVVVIDNLSRGHRAAVDERIPFYRGDVGDRKLILSITQQHAIDACMHFAAFAYVGESVQDPALYFENNVIQGIQLLNTLREAAVKYVVFSSSCTVYGEPQYIPIDEIHPKQPANPYGLTKLFIEQALQSYDQAYGLKFVSLRYFNAAGALPGRGEGHDPEPHLIPNILAAAANQQLRVPVFGGDYPTPDGTPIRDYIHVLDLGAAHILALKHLRSGRESEFINLGNGVGYSVLDVIEAARQVTGATIEVELSPKRAGDPSHLVAHPGKAKEILGWEPAFSDLNTIIQSAWDWHQQRPRGYEQIT